MSHTALKLPQTVEIGDITVRDGLQALEHLFTTTEKLQILEDLILCGFKHVEVTNFGHPKYLPQFADAEELLTRLFQSERVGKMLKQNGGDVTVTAVTINEKAVDRAIDYKVKHGVGPDCLLQMVSTDPAHHKVNSGKTLEDYWGMTERCIQKAKEMGMAMCGTVSTIWGSPLAERHTDLNTAVEFSKRYLEIGASYIEQADHDGSADPARVYEYFQMILDPERMGQFADPKFHLAHFHTTRGMGMANYLAALQAGIRRFETSLSGIGGQPANILDGTPVSGTGAYYHKAHSLCGLVGTEDFTVMCEAMGIHTGISIQKLLETGRRFRDQVLTPSKEDMAKWIESVSAITGIDRAVITSVSSAGDLAEDLLERAADKVSETRQQDHDSAKQSVLALLKALYAHMHRGLWVPSRAETLDSGLPPSPHLMALIQGK